MNDDRETRSRFALALKVCATAVDIELGSERITVYWKLLEPYPLEDIEQAFHHFAKTSKWFPKVAEIIEYITPAEPDVQQMAISVWDHDVFPRLSNSRSAKADDQIAERVVQDLGGWVLLGRKSIAELVWSQKDFVARYVAYQETNVAPIRRARLNLTGPILIDRMLAAASEEGNEPV